MFLEIIFRKMNRLELILMIIALAGMIALEILHPTSFFRNLDKNIIIPRLFP